jgi:hypothetical protein
MGGAREGRRELGRRAMRIKRGRVGSPEDIAWGPGGQERGRDEGSDVIVSGKWKV